MGTAVDLTLPRATGGNGAITYTLTPATPTGVNFDAATRVLSGMPSTVAGATTYTYTAGDTDGSDSRHRRGLADLHHHSECGAGGRPPGLLPSGEFSLQ